MLLSLTEIITPNLANLVGYKMKARLHEVGEDKEIGRGIGGESDQNSNALYACMEFSKKKHNYILKQNLPKCHNIRHWESDRMKPR